MSLEVWVPGCCHRGSWRRPITPGHAPGGRSVPCPGLLPDQLIPFCVTIMHEEGAGGVPKDEQAFSQDEPGRNTRKSLASPLCPALSSVLPQKLPSVLRRRETRREGRVCRGIKGKSKGRRGPVSLVACGRSSHIEDQEGLVKCKRPGPWVLPPCWCQGGESCRDQGKVAARIPEGVPGRGGSS